jgi:hypothetical protein
MAKASGLGNQLYVDSTNLSNDIGAIKRISGGNSPLVITGIDKLAYERVGGKRDGGIDFTAWNNTAAAREHAVLSTLPTADRQVLVAVSTLIGSDAAAMIAKQVNYDPTRGADGSLTEDVSAVANGFGLEWGNLVTACDRTDTTATSPATGADLNAYGGASVSFSWQAYLIVSAFAGTSVTCTLQDSADNSAFANLTGGAFTAASAPGTQRLAGGAAATVRRYVRVITTGTFSNAVFTVMFVRNISTVVF